MRFLDEEVDVSRGRPVRRRLRLEHRRELTAERVLVVLTWRPCTRSWAQVVRRPRRRMVSSRFPGSARSTAGCGRLLRQERLGLAPADREAVRVRVEVAHRHRASAPLRRDRAPVGQALTDGRADRVAVVSRVDHDVDEVRQVERDLARLVRGPHARGEVLLHVLFHRREPRLPRERVAVDARERQMKARLVVARLPVDLVRRDAHVPLGVHRRHPRPRLVGGEPVVRGEALRSGGEVRLVRSSFVSTMPSAAAASSRETAPIVSA